MSTGAMTDGSGLGWAGAGAEWRLPLLAVIAVEASAGVMVAFLGIVTYLAAACAVLVLA